MQSPSPPLVGCMNKAGSLPLIGVMLSSISIGTYEPLRLPRRPAALSFPYTPPSMVSPPPSRVSSTGLYAFRNMPPLLPREMMCATSVIPAHFQRPSPFDHRVGFSNLVYEATYRFTCVAACYFANWELTTPDYSDAAPLNYQGVRTTPWAGLQPARSYSCYCERSGLTSRHMLDCWA